MSGTGSDIRASHEPGVFPTLDTDVCESGSDAAKRVCIATPDVPELVKNGEIATAYHHLARLLAERGHDVVIAYVASDAADARLMEQARASYAGFGVSFEPIVPRPDNKYIVSQVRAPTWALYDWLCAREHPFDILHVSDYRGLGYGPLLAKSLGLAFGAMHFVIHGHAPTLWAAEGNRQLLSKEQQLGWVFMEQRSVELADTLTCGSAHLLGWMRDAGYAMPARSYVWPNPFPAPETTQAAVTGRAARDGARLEEVVFFGRLEPRKGLVLFVDAIDRLARRGQAPTRVTFLGGPSVRCDGPELIRTSTRSWPVDVCTITDYGTEEAITYLSQPGRLAVLPSLQENSSLSITECLQAGIPFLATETGERRSSSRPRNTLARSLQPTTSPLASASRQWPVSRFARSAPVGISRARSRSGHAGTPRLRLLRPLAHASHGRHASPAPRPRWSRSAWCITSGPNCCAWPLIACSFRTTRPSRQCSSTTGAKAPRRLRASTR